jgi:pyruvate carboxylase subunit B
LAPSTSSSASPAPSWKNTISTRETIRPSSTEDKALFDDALEAATRGKTVRVLELCQRIEARFHYPEPDDIVRKAQIPGGMYTNMRSQLQEAKLDQHLEEVLAIVPQVRLACGVPPLVTPTSQIVGVQAVNCVVDRIQGKPFYTTISKNFLELVKGAYGKTPWPVDPDFREKICGLREETPYDTSKYKKQPNPQLAELGGAGLAQNEKEELLLELFPSVADKYLRGQRKREWDAARPAAPLAPPAPEKPARYSAEFWERELALATEG